jgi:hypothetical protein
LRLVEDLQARTPPGGVHVVLSARGAAGAGVIPIGTDTLLALYDGWRIERRPRGRRGAFAAAKPERQSDTQVNVSE